MIVCLHLTFIQELCETGGAHWEIAKNAATQLKELIQPRSDTGVRRDPHSPDSLVVQGLGFHTVTGG